MDLVKASKNDYFAVFLGTRVYGPDRRTLLGRETFACPVLWRDGDFIVKDQELIAGRVVTPEPWYRVAREDSRVRLHRLAHPIFDETLEVGAGESAALYRNKDGFMAWPNDTGATAQIRLVSQDGQTVQAYCNSAPMGAPQDLKPLVEAARKTRFNGVGIGILRAPSRAAESTNRVTVKGPEERLAVSVETDAEGVPRWRVACGATPVTAWAPLGLKLDCGDFTRALKIVATRTGEFKDSYSLKTIKTSSVQVEMNTLEVDFEAPSGERMGLEVRVGRRDIAFRYVIPRQKKGETGCARVMDERTTFAFLEGTTQFTTPQSKAMISWKRSKPSYEEPYVCDVPVGVKGQYNRGWTFSCLFRLGETWLLVCETGTDANYCGCRLGEVKGRAFKVEFPMPEENNGNGTVEPAFALPGATPWRTLTVGSLSDIVETTVMWDVVKPKYETVHDYVYGASSWSWIVWDDDSMNWDDQVKFVDLAAAMGWKYTLVDAGWDTALGKRGARGVFQRRSFDRGAS